mmetsp:Transcript_31705/g.47058  ORF Transcript_31705/g.47058 Transcript_31705/m.47058 type:complete len:254 (-) Transcript_31705:513-1274(-)
MAGLKKGHNHGGSAPTPTLSMKRQSPTVSAAPSHYTSAIATLGDVTMNQACTLLLSERDYSDNKTDDGIKTDMEKMVALYNKAAAAVAVVDEYVDSMPTAPQLVPSSSRAAPVSSGASSSRSLKPQGGKVMQPPRRTSLAQLAHRGRGTTGPAAVRPTVSRQASDSSASSTTSNNSRTNSSKKQRLNPGSQQDHGRRNPPQSAVAFLQALNSKSKSGGSGTTPAPSSEDAATSTSPRRSSPKKVLPRRSARNR